MSKLPLSGKYFLQVPEGVTYGDWTGAALPPVTLFDAHRDQLVANLFGNPHSAHGPSMRSSDEAMAARSAILKYFNAPEEEYDVIFTPSATGAIRLLEHYKFEGGELLLLEDNHNSVNGLRETAKRKGATCTRYAPIKADLTIDDEALEQMLQGSRSSGQKLFAFPAKSNYTGNTHSLDCVRYAKKYGWDVLLDAAAYSSNRRLNLSVIKPDFVPISFYKMFGYPTGIGCLIIRKEAFNRLHKGWFTGGPIRIVSVKNDFFVPEGQNHALYEDGTIAFSSIPAVRNGLDFLESLGDISAHAVSIATKLYDQLDLLGDDVNGPMVYTDRGSDTVTFNIMKSRKIVGPWIFEEYANKNNVYVRTGCFCNPGVNEKIFDYSVKPLMNMKNDDIASGKVVLDTIRQNTDNPVGAIRVSFGYANTEADATRVAEVVKKFLAE